MFSRKQRIKKTEIRNFFEKPDFLFNSANFILRGFKNNLSFPRFSIILSKNIKQNSVMKHFLKRKINSALVEINFKKSFDLVFFLKNQIKNQKKEELKKELEILLKKCIID